MLLDCEEGDREREKNIQGLCEAPMSYHQCSKHHCHMQDLFWTTKLQQLLHHRMEKREVNQEEFAATCFCVHPQFQLYPSTTFAVLRTSSSSQNTADRYSRGGHSNCEHSCVVYSSLSTAIFSQYACFASRKVLDPLQWWDHRSEKVTEHQTCQSSHVNVATLAALFGVNLVALSLSLLLGGYLSCPGLNLAEILFRSFALVGL
jgi:hypothetical protein